MYHCLSMLIAFLLCTASWAQEHAVINNARSPFTRLKCIDLDDCHWTDGFWADKVKHCCEVMIPHLGTLMEDPEIIHAYENFLVAAGEKEGVFKGWSFHDGDFYKYVEALTYAYAMTNDECINQRLDEIIAVIGKSQREDGYISTYIQIGHGVQGFHHESGKGKGE